MRKDAGIFVAGSNMPVGIAILDKLHDSGFTNIIGEHGQEPNPRKPEEIKKKFIKFRPEYVFYTTGKSAGISGNQKRPADLMSDNIECTMNIIRHAYLFGIKKLLYLGSSCCYPRDCKQPIKEKYLLAGPLEPTNEAYAVAKIAGIKLCQAYRQQYGVNFITAIPGNAFGPGDDFSPENSHVIASLISRIHKAKELNHKSVEVWGTGTPRRDFIFFGDLADACIFVMKKYNGHEPINIGCNYSVSIAELAELIKCTVGFKGDLIFNHTKPDGMPMKYLDSNKLFSLGWRPAVSLADGLAITYKWYIESTAK